MDGIADYRFDRSLGVGDHGEFFVAQPPPRLGLQAELVAVKVFDDATTDDGLRLVTRELRAFAAARSPYLVPLLDAGQDGDFFFYATKYFPDGSLAEPRRPITRDHRVRAVAHASRAAHALHEAGVVHRAIKPRNVLLADGGGMLSDLGLAQLIAPGRTVTGLGPVDAVEYVDPAVLRGESPSRSSDIWSLGVTLHKSLSGEGVYGPSAAKDPLALIRTVLRTDPAISDTLTEAESAVVRRCIASNGARFTTAEELALALDDLVPA